MQRPGEKSKLGQSSCNLQNLKFSLSQLSDQNNIAKWVAAMCAKSIDLSLIQYFFKFFYFAYILKSL